VKYIEVRLSGYGLHPAARNVLVFKENWPSNFLHRYVLGILWYHLLERHTSVYWKRLLGKNKTSIHFITDTGHGFYKYSCRAQVGFNEWGLNIRAVVSVEKL